MNPSTKRLQKLISKSVTEKYKAVVNTDELKSLVDNVRMSIADVLDESDGSDFKAKLEYMRDELTVIRTIDSMHEGKETLSDDDRAILLAEIEYYIDEEIEKFE